MLSTKYIVSNVHSTGLLRATGNTHFVLGLLEDSLSATGDISVAAGVGDVASGAEGSVGPVAILLSSAALQL